MKIRLSIAVLALFVARSLTARAQAPWPESYKGWEYRQTLQVDAGKVPGELTNFPMLVTEACIQSELWDHARSNGTDILFAGDDGETKLSYEVEKYNTNSQELAIWVKVPTLYAAANTFLYMYYGNVNASDQQDTSNVWDSNYAAVWHLCETNGTHYDSTTNSNDGTPPAYDKGDVAVSACDDTNDWTGDSLSLDNIDYC